MKQLYKAGNRGILSIMTGLMVVALLSISQPYVPQKNVLAWWGSIYPEFCFLEVDENGKNVEKNTSEQRPKISFWLAKAFERW